MSNSDFWLITCCTFLLAFLVTLILIRGIDKFVFPRSAKIIKLREMGLVLSKDNLNLKSRLSECYQVLGYHEVDTEILDAVFLAAMGNPEKEIKLPYVPIGDSIMVTDLNIRDAEMRLQGVKLIFAMRNWGEHEDFMSSNIKRMESDIEKLKEAEHD